MNILKFTLLLMIIQLFASTAIPNWIEINPIIKYWCKVLYWLKLNNCLNSAVNETFQKIFLNGLEIIEIKKKKY